MLAKDSDTVHTLQTSSAQESVLQESVYTEKTGEKSLKN